MDTCMKLSVSELLTKICSVELTTCSLAGDSVELHNVIIANVVSSTYKCVHCDGTFETYLQVSTHVKVTHLEEDNGTVQLVTPIKEENGLAQTSITQGEKIGKVDKPANPEKGNETVQTMTVDTPANPEQGNETVQTMPVDTPANPEQGNGTVQTTTVVTPANPEKGNDMVQMMANPEGGNGMIQNDPDIGSTDSGTGTGGKEVSVIEDTPRCETEKASVGVVDKETSVIETAVKSITVDESAKGDDSLNKSGINESSDLNDERESETDDDDTVVVSLDGNESGSSTVEVEISPCHDSSTAVIADSQTDRATGNTGRENRPRRRKCVQPRRYLVDQAEDRPSPRKRELSRGKPLDQSDEQTEKRPRRNLPDKSKTKTYPGYVGQRAVLTRKAKKDKFRNAGRHVTRARVSCPICSKVLNSVSTLGAHMRFHKAEGTIQHCAVCSLRMTSTEELETHAKTHPGYKPFKCSQCEASYVTHRSFRKHKQNHQLGLEVRFRKEEDLVKHCEMCSVTVSSVVELEIHAKTHPGYKPFKCSHCGATYTLDRSLRKHKENHVKPASPKVYYCKECGLKYNNATALKNHAAIHPCYNPFSKTPYECKATDCDKSFENSKDLESHTATHEGYKPFGCSLCGADYFKKADFDEHAKTHSSEALLFCFDCNKSFTSRSGLKKHLFTHNKPFQCTVCFKTFALEGSFTDHKRSHTDERPYLCADCGKAFRSNSALICHSKTHLTENQKPFQCPLCDMRFSGKHKLTEHVRRHGGVRPYMCSRCGLSFVTSGELSRHIKRHVKRDLKEGKK